MNAELERRIRFLADTGDPFTADDVTAAGGWAVDPDHAPNGSQNAIGSAMREAARKGLIEPTGGTVRSQAPYRKGGRIQVWRGVQRRLDL